MRGFGESLGVLRERDFRLLFIGQSVSLLGDGMVRVALPFAALEVSGSASSVGIVLAAFALALIAALLAGGVVADRTSRRGVMVAADLLRLASQGTMAVLLIGGVAELWMLALLAGVAGAASGFFQPAATGLLPAVVAPEWLQSANGLRATSMAAGEIAGPVIAGILVASAGAGWALAVDAVTFGVSAAFLLLLRLAPRIPVPPMSFWHDLRDGWRAVRSRGWLWGLLLSAAAGNFTVAAFTALGPVVADRDLGGAAAWGAVLAAMGAGGLVGALLSIGSRPRRPLVVVGAAYAVLALPTAFLAAAAPVPLLAASAFLFGIGLTLGNTVWESTLQHRIPGESLSRVSAYESFASFALRPLGLALWGPIAVAIGLSPALWLAFTLHLTTALAVFAVPEVRTMRDAPSTQASRR